MLDAELVAELAPHSATPGATSGVVKRPRLGVFFWCCTAWLGLLAVVTIFAPYLPFQNPDYQDFTTVAGNDINATPSGQHLLGTDQLARDLLSRIVWGGRVSLVIGLLATVIGIGIGGFLGMFAAYWRGKVDAVLSTAMYCGLAFPAIVAVLAILTFWGSTESHIIIVLGIFSIPLIYRLVRAATLACATKEYVTAAKAQGATSVRVILRDILPNVAPALIAYTVFTIGGVIGTEGALGVLGKSVNDPTPSWGNLISGASSYPSNLSYVLAPAIVLFLTLVALNYSGERIRVHFEVSEAKL